MQIGRKKTTTDNNKRQSEFCFRSIIVAFKPSNLGHLS